MRSGTMVVALALAACAGSEGEAPREPADGGEMLVPSDDIPYELTYGGETAAFDATGGGSPNRREGAACATSFLMQFFVGIAEIGEEPDSLVEVYLPGHAPGARSVVPTLDDRIDFWTPPQWRIDGAIRAVFGGVAELDAFDADRVALRFEDTQMCTIPVWGHLEAGSYDSYGDLATDCVAVDEVALEAVADPPGSFTWTTEPEVVRSDVGWPTTWTTEAGDGLCY